MLEKDEKVFDIHRVVETFNCLYKKNHTVEEVAELVCEPLDILENLNVESPFRLIYNTSYALYELYSEHNGNVWDFCTYCNALIEHRFLL